MMDMDDIILDRIAFGGVKELEEIRTILKRWSLIWLTVVIVGSLSIFH